MKKKLICLVLAVMCALSFAACGGGGNHEGTDGGDNWWQTTGTLNKDENGNVIFTDVEIRLTTVVSGEDEEPFRQLITLFNAEHRGEINVIVDSVGQDSYETSVASRITNNSNAPDLIMSHQKGHKSFAEYQLIQPFNEAMEASGISISMDDYAAGLAQYTSLGYDDYLFGVPIDAQSLVVYYNKDLLADLGETLPANREELFEVCGKAKAQGLTPIAWSTSNGYFNSYLFPTAIVQNGGVMYDSDTYKANWYTDESNRTAIKNAMTAIRDMMYGENKIADYNQSTSSILQEFLSDQALFYIAEPWSMESLLNAYAAQNNLSREQTIADYVGGTSMAGWFALEDSENANKIFGDSHFFAISKTCTDINKKAAICEFVRWFTQTGSVGADWAQAGHISASKIVMESEEYKNNTIVQNFVNNFYGGIDNFVCIGNTPFYSDLSSALSALSVSAFQTSDTSGDDALIKRAENTLNNVVDFVGM